jgi:hypothetical protein
MDIEINYAGDKLHIEVENPYKIDVEKVASEMSTFLQEKGLNNDLIKELYLVELLPKMVRGVAGCEAGCPANAHMLVRTGFRKFALKYIEGGILSAKHSLKGESQEIEIKVFPDF